MANDQPMWGNNRAVAPTPEAAIVAEDPRRKKQTMHPKDIKEDIEEIIMIEILAIGMIIMKTKTQTPGEENPLIPHLPEKKPDESEFEKTMKEFNHQATIQDLETKFGRISDHQSSRPPGKLPCNTETNPKPSTSTERLYRPLTARNEHLNAIFTRSGKTYDPPANPNTKTAIFLDDSEDEAEEVRKEAEPLPKKPTQTETPPLNAYKPKIPHP
ncbi:hypothetical protein Tco_1175058 [Tanacetum coccineum]